MARFYELEGGTKLDGVMAIDTTVIEDLLTLTGPITVPGYDFIIDAKTFVDNTENQVEISYFQDKTNIKENEPKKYIDDLSKVLSTALNALTDEQKADLPLILLQAFKRKSIQVEHFDSSISPSLSALDINGQVKGKSVNSDYFYIVNANLGGKKSSRSVLQNTKIFSTIAEDGSVKHSLAISRKHIGDGGWPDGNNENLMRILVPKGSKLISQAWENNQDEDQKILVTEEAGLTVFEVWFATPIGQEKILKIDYQTPVLAKNGQYKIYHQKQPGAQNLNIVQQIEAGAKIKKFSGVSQMENLTSKSLKAEFDQDQDYQLIANY